jgi:hypothetical protein
LSILILEIYINTLVNRLSYHINFGNYKSVAKKE